MKQAGDGGGRASTNIRIHDSEEKPGHGPDLEVLRHVNVVSQRVQKHRSKVAREAAKGAVGWQRRRDAAEAKPVIRHATRAVKPHVHSCISKNLLPLMSV